MYQQSQNKLRVFKRFAEVCPYSINCDSIEKRNPPEPVILSKLSDGRVIAFEAVECIDSFLASSIWNSVETARVFYDAIEKLPNDELHRIKSKFGNLLITIVFAEDREWVERACLVKPIFEQLWTVENEKRFKEMEKSFSGLSPKEFKQFNEILDKENITEDELLKREPFSKSVIKQFDLKLPQNLRDFVKRIKIMPGISNGPSFNITDPVWLTNPIENRILKKIKKKYKSKYRTELLVYYEVQPELPADAWILPEMDSVTEELENSIFKRVWLYSATQNKIIDVFPDLT